MNAMCLAKGMDFTELMALVTNNAEMFDENPFRTSYSPESPHREVHDIILRSPKLDLNMQDDCFCFNWPAMGVFGKALYPHIAELMTRTGALGVGRIIITALEKDKQIYGHVDEGEAASYFQRFHLVLCAENAILNVGEDSYEQNTGDVWWVNNKQPHSVNNYSDIPRVVVVVDLELLNVAGEDDE